MTKRRTQALVFIHGIGEQLPMETLRRFAEAVLPDPPQGGPKYFSKPDPLSESLELRKLQDRSQPRTHLFEYYWAYKVEGTTFGHVGTWLSSLLFRRPNRVPPHLRPLWLLSWLLLVVAIVSAGAGVAEYVGEFTSRLPSFAISAASAVALSLLQASVLYRLGDAARYLSPHPRNIKLRQTIRADGIRLLRNIHESGEYDRVIVVGHSLGSVIAYDILKHLWQDYNRDYREPCGSEQKALANLEAAGDALQTDREGETLDAYVDAQVRLWWELRALGNPWLVTDLVTAGSPLAHAALLLADDATDLALRQSQRELPTAPPVAEIERRGGEERRRYAFRVWEPYAGGVHLRALHHAGLFACTRWTNLYFPSTWGLFGDIVGGPLRPWFGPGIRDIAVRSSNTLRAHTLLAHTSYWHLDRAEGARASSPGRKRPLALAALRDALDLDGTSSYAEDGD